MTTALASRRISGTANLPNGRTRIHGRFTTLGGATAGPLRPSSQRVDCPDCGRTFNANLIASGPVIKDPHSGECSQVHSVYCPDCQVVHVQRRSTNEDGTFQGEVLAEGKYSGKGDIQQFKKKH